jgi:hypothetical protein
MIRHVRRSTAKDYALLELSMASSIWWKIPTDVSGTLNNLYWDSNSIRPPRLELNYTSYPNSCPETRVWSRFTRIFLGNQLIPDPLGAPGLFPNIPMTKIFIIDWNEKLIIDLSYEGRSRRIESRPESMTRVESRGLLTWVYHIGYSTLPFLL